MNFYNFDFGPILGKICDFDLPETRMNGLAWVLPARFEGARWEVRMTLGREMMESLRKDPLFSWVELNEGV